MDKLSGRYHLIISFESTCRAVRESLIKHRTQNTGHNCLAPKPDSHVRFPAKQSCPFRPDLMALVRTDLHDCIFYKISGNVFGNIFKNTSARPEV